MFSQFLGKYRGGEFVGHVVKGFLAFKKVPDCFLKWWHSFAFQQVAETSSTPSASLNTNLLLPVLWWSRSVIIQCYFIALICISLITNDVKCLFMCLTVWCEASHVFNTIFDRYVDLECFSPSLDPLGKNGYLKTIPVCYFSFFSPLKIDSPIT